VETNVRELVAALDAVPLVVTTGTWPVVGT
jgi:hypothetical protein